MRHLRIEVYTEDGRLRIVFEADRLVGRILRWSVGAIVTVAGGLAVALAKLIHG